MKPYLKFILLFAIVMLMAFVIGFIVQYFFHYKIYVPLVIGSVFPLLLSWKKINSAPANNQ